MALARHLQHAKIETDTSRQSGQFGCPQSGQFDLRKGQSRWLAIHWSFCLSVSMTALLRLREVNPEFAPPFGLLCLLRLCIEEESHCLEFRL